MPAPRIRLNHATAAKLLRSPEFARLVNTVADQVAHALDDEDGGFIEEYTTDRGAAAVLVPAHVQARSGALTRAAAAVGLNVVQAQQ